MKFKLKDKVKLKVSGETGKVTGVCEYLNSESQYLVSYKSNEGTAKQIWWEESTIKRRKG